MTITQVQYVLETARCGSMTRAAENYYISQPALSAQIKALETEMGCMLFHRSPQGITLTAAGEAFCQSAEPVLQSWQQLQTCAEGLRGTICRTIRIGFGTRAVSNDLLNAVMDFFDSHPDTNVTFITDLNENVLEALEAGRMDLAIDRLPPAELVHHKELFFIDPLLTERQCILLSPDDPRAGLPELPFHTLDGKPAAGGPEGSVDEMEMKLLCQAHGVRVSRVFRSDSVSTVMAMVRSGKGAALGPVSFGKHFGVAAVPMLPEMNIDLNLICRKEDRSHVLVRELGKYLKKKMAEK